MHIAFICVKQRVERGGTRDAIYAEEMDEKGLSRSAWWDGPLFGHSYGGVFRPVKEHEMQSPCYP